MRSGLDRERATTGWPVEMRQKCRRRGWTKRACRCCRSASRRIFLARQSAAQSPRRSRRPHRVMLINGAARSDRAWRRSARPVRRHASRRSRSPRRSKSLLADAVEIGSKKAAFPCPDRRTDSARSRPNPIAAVNLVRAHLHQRAAHGDLGQNLARDRAGRDPVASRAPRSVRRRDNRAGRTWPHR